MLQLNNSNATPEAPANETTRKQLAVTSTQCTCDIYFRPEGLSFRPQSDTLTGNQDMPRTYRICMREMHKAQNRKPQ